MHRVDVQVPETSLRAQVELLVSIGAFLRSITTPTIQPISLFIPDLSIRQSVVFTYKQASATWKLEVNIGDFLPELQGEVDQWFRMELKSNESGSDTGDSLASLSIRVVINISLLNNEDPEDATICMRCQAHLKQIQALEMNVEALTSQLRVYPQLEADLETLRVGNSEVYFPQSLPQQERDYFKFALLGLSEKAKLSEMLQQELASLRTQLKNALVQHQELKMVSEETTGQLSTQLVQSAENHNSLVQEKTQVSESFQQLKSDLQTKIRKEKELTSKITLLQQELETKVGRDVLLEQATSELHELRAILTQTETRNQALTTELRRATEEFSITQSQLATYNQQLLKEKAELSNKLQSSQDELLQKTRLLDQNMSEKIKAEGQVAALSAQSRLKDELVQSLSVLDRKLNISEESRALISQKFRAQISDSEFEIAAISKENVRLTKEIEHLHTLLSHLEQEVVDRTNLLETQQREIWSLNQHIAVLEHALCVQEDTRGLVESLSSQHDQASGLNLELASEVDSLAEQLLKLSEKTLAGQQVIAKLADVVERQNEELRVIRKLFRHQAPYSPLEGDLVDSALGQYLNHRLLPTPIPFRREEQGVYSFGSKRVFVKVEQGRVIIRVGGGFMNIDEFIAVYAPMELEKLETRRQERPEDPLIQKLSQYLDGKDYTACLGLMKKQDSSLRHRSPS